MGCLKGVSSATTDTAGSRSCNRLDLLDYWAQLGGDMNSKRRNSDSVNFDRRLFLGGSAAVAAGLWLGGGLAGRAWAVDSGSSGGPVGETAYGKIRGRMEGHINAFRGVPYGASTE